MLIISSEGRGYVFKEFQRSSNVCSRSVQDLYDLKDSKDFLGFWDPTGILLGSYSLGSFSLGPRILGSYWDPTLWDPSLASRILVPPTSSCKNTHVAYTKRTVWILRSGSYSLTAHILELVDHIPVL